MTVPPTDARAVSPAPVDSNPRQEATATLSTYAEMGPVWQNAVVDSFMAKANTLAAQQYQGEIYRCQQQAQTAKAERAARMWTLIIALVMAAPLTAIAAHFAGLIGLIVAWAGIAATVTAIVYNQSSRAQP